MLNAEGEFHSAGMQRPFEIVGGVSG